MTLANGNPMTRVLSTLLIFEAIVFGLAIPGLIVVAGYPALTAVGLAGGVLLLAVVASSTMRRRLGFGLGWLTQAVGISLGLATPEMYVMGGIFAALWILTFVLGKRLDGAR